MSDKISPPTKPVGKSDGINQGASTLTTPNKTDNKIWSDGKSKGSIFGKK